MRTALLISDIHSNLHALQAVLDDAQAQFGEFDAVLVLGDIVGYGAHPNEVVRAVLSLPNCHAVKGNHDAAALGEIPVDDFNPVAAQAALWTQDNLSQTNIDSLRVLPLVSSVEGVTCCHASPRSPLWEYIFDARAAIENFQYFDTKGCAFGHTHVPSFFGLRNGRVDADYVRHNTAIDTLEYDKWMVNPGSVGQPRDGDPRASYAVIRSDAQDADLANRRYHVEFRRVRYDVARAQAAILDRGLPPVLAARLAEGR